MRIISVVGTRPQLIKAAALQPVLRRDHEEIFVDTGQHYDDAMAGDFFGELGLARPDHALGIGGGGHGDQTGRMLIALEPMLEAAAPDAVVVFGDTNSTLAGALAAAKLGIPVAHIEAGLRSFDRRMPEELNRVVADHLSSWLFAPTPAAVANLAAEGITAGVLQVGDLMLDLAARTSAEVRDPAVLAALASRLNLPIATGGFLFATVHRAENRRPAAITAWAALLGAVAAPDRPVVLALHPGTRVALESAGIILPPNVIVIEPQGYRTSLALQLHSAAVLTDSGGVQRESAWLGVPCLVLRTTTEWVETVGGSGSSAVLVGLDRSAAVRELDARAPREHSKRQASDRAARLRLVGAGAAELISSALRSR
ncbi:MAG: UDP-N-acetylglucosamine 2-epimerase (non-hydrolyzing) [Candidatus Limnocylindrales bacterium]|jgi:UDP-N-acetylglucosamine 2-epimerase